MVINHIVKGNENTTLHTFEITQVDMSIIISEGTYYRAGEKLFEDEEGGVLIIETPVVDTDYELWICQEGIEVLVREQGNEFDKPTNPIDRLVWFNVPANAITLDEVEIHAIKMEREDI